MMTGITLQNVSFCYQKNTKILDDINLEIKKGEFLGITGINGSGKSTFTYLLNGLIPHATKGYMKGSIHIDGISTASDGISTLSRKVGMVFQNPDFSLFNLTVNEEVKFGLENFKLGNYEERIDRALNQVGLHDFKDRDPQTLSFGQKQKLNLACVLALDTDYIVLDEPTAMLDYKSSVELYQILEKLHKNKKTIIVVEHDTDFLWKYSTKTIILDKNKIKTYGTTQKVLSDKEMLKLLGIKIPNMDN